MNELSRRDLLCMGGAAALAGAALPRGLHAQGDPSSRAYDHGVSV